MANPPSQNPGYTPVAEHFAHTIATMHVYIDVATESFRRRTRHFWPSAKAKVHIRATLTPVTQDGRTIVNDQASPAHVRAEKRAWSHAAVNRTEYSICNYVDNRINIHSWREGERMAF